MLRLLPLLAALAAPAAAQATEAFLTVDGPPDADGPTAITYTPDGAQVLVTHRDSDSVTFLDAATGAILALVDVGAGPLDVEVTPDGRHALVPCGEDDVLSVVDVATHAVVANVQLSVLRPYRVQLNAGAGIAVVGAEGDGGLSAVAVVDLATLTELYAFPTVRQDETWRPGIEWRLDEVGEPITGFVRFDLSADGRRLLVPSFSERVVAVYDVPTGALVASVPTFWAPLAVALTSDGTRCLVLEYGGIVGEFQVLDLATWTLTPPVDVPSPGVDPDGLAIVPGDQYALIATGWDLVVVDLATGTVASMVDLQYAIGYRIALSHDGTRAYVSCPELAVVDLAQLQTVAARHDDFFEDVAASPAGDRAALLRHRVAEDVTVVRTDQAPALPTVFAVPSGPAPEGDGTTMVATSADGAVVVACNVQSRDLAVFDRDGLVARVPVGILPRTLGMDAAGRFAVVGSAIDGTVEVLDLSLGASLGTLTLYPTQVFALGVSPDGTEAWVRTSEELVFVALTAPPRELSRIDAELAWYYGERLWQRRVEASADGRLLAVPIQINSSGHAFSIVDAETRTELVRFPLGGGDLPVDAAFRSDGRALFATGTGDVLMRFAIAGPVPKAAGRSFLNDPAQVAVGPDDRYVYVAGNGKGSLSPHLSVVDGDTMTCVAELDLPSRAVALEAGGPYVFAALENGVLLRFLAAGPGTVLLETVGGGEVATDLRVDSARGRVLLAQPGERDGIRVLSWPAEPAPVRYCTPANVSSIGLPATVEARGWFDSGGWFELEAADVPPDEVGIFLVGETRVFLPNVPGSQGNLCVGGRTGRYTSDVLHTGGAGRFALAVDPGVLPLGGGPVAVQPGETWHFQAWFTDVNPSPTANFTDAVAVTFR